MTTSYHVEFYCQVKNNLITHFCQKQIEKDEMENKACL